jgi:hypothetical protein
LALATLGYTLPILGTLAVVLRLAEPAKSQHLNSIPILRSEPLTDGVNKNRTGDPKYTLSCQNQDDKNVGELDSIPFQALFSAYLLPFMNYPG